MSKAGTYLASDLVTVYSNHKMLGIKLVSRTRKYSEIGLSTMKKEIERTNDPSGHSKPVFIHLFRLRIISPCDTRMKQRNESTAYHAAILGNIGVSTSCVKKNQIMPIVLPTTPP